METETGNQRQYWDDVAGKKTFTIPLDISLLNRSADTGSTILDYGCGYGRTLAELAEHGYRSLRGCDFSASMIARGRRLYPGLDLRVAASAEDLPAEEYDVVVLFAVLTCIESSDEQAALIAGLSRSLKPGGFIYVQDFLLNTDPRNVKRYREFAGEFDNYGTFRLSDGGVVRHHEEAYLGNLLGGFEMLSVNKVEFRTMNGNTSDGISFFGRKRPAH